MKQRNIFEKWFLMEDISPDYFKKCSNEKRTHEKFSAIERALCGMSSTDVPISHFDFERIERNLFRHRIDFSWIFKRRTLALTALASAFCALVISIVSFSKITTMSDEFLRKGDPALGALPKLYAFCISPDSSTVKAVGDDSVTCRLDSELQFALSNSEKSEFNYVYITGIRSDGQRMWYYPEFGNDKSVKIKNNMSKEPFGTSIRLSSNHIKGSVDITAVFSAESLSYDDILQFMNKDKEKKNIKNIYIQFFSFKID